MSVEKVPLYYRRERKVYGVRNHVLVVPTTFCVNEVAAEIAKDYLGETWGEHDENYVAVALHDAGCCHVGFDRDVTFNVLLGVCSNPNVYGVVLVSLGCGQFDKLPKAPLDSFLLYRRLRERGVKVRYVNVQEHGYERSIRLGRKYLEELVNEAKKEKRVPGPVKKLVIGVGNGASDPTSGLFANPAVGHMVDIFVREFGGTVVFSQATEVLGAEEYLLSKVKNERVREKVVRFLQNLRTVVDGLRDYLGISEPTPGNIEAGISTLAEKSLGTVLKAGIDPGVPIEDLLPYAHKVPRRGGVYFMEGPGEDLLAITGMVAGGANIIVFTTGLGTPIGCIVAPVVKVTANAETYRKLREIIDVYIPVEELFSGKYRSLKDIAREVLLPYLLKVASGEIRTRSEVNGQRDFAVRELWFKL